MSGGSFEYLYCKTPDEIANRLDLLEGMAESLADYPEGEAAARDVTEMVAVTRTWLRWMDVRMERLSEVMRAVEWHHSADSGPEQVDKALREYYGLGGDA